MVAPQITPLPSCLSDAKTQIISRALTDQHGVFWPLKPEYRPQAETLEGSLGFGTAGVLLCLLELHLIEPDRSTEQLLLKGADWLIAHLQKRGFQHGFYAGSAGVWFALDKLEQNLDGLNSEWRHLMHDQLATVTFGDTPAGLVSGAGGSLLGTLLIAADEEMGTAENALISCLLACTKLHPQGVFWDFSPTSVRPPAGFAQGNAGVEYALAGLRQLRGKESRALLAGSLQYADSLFDSSEGNWLDQDCSNAVKGLGQDEVLSRVKRGQFSRRARCTSPEDSISWSGGTCGLLVARLFLRKLYAGHGVGESADRDCERALKRLASVTSAELEQLDNTVLHGLPGVVLSLQETLPFLNDEEKLVVSALIDRSCAIVDSRPLKIEHEDLSLFSGLAGLIYARLATDGSSPTRHLLSPLSALSGSDFRAADKPSALNLAPLVDRRFPLIKSKVQLAAEDLTPVVNLQSIRKIIDDRQQGLTDADQRVIDYELDLHESLSGTEFQALLWRELECQMRFSRFYDEGMDEALLSERFELSHSVTLLSLEFDPHAESTDAPSSPNLILRYRTSRGIIEIKLSELQFALLREFENGAWAVQVIATVIRRVDSAQVTQRQLAELAKQNIRAFVREGYLETAKTPRAQKWIRQSALKKAQRRLFPSAAN
jgi:hypothetical protein